MMEHTWNKKDLLAIACSLLEGPLHVKYSDWKYRVACRNSPVLHTGEQTTTSHGMVNHASPKRLQTHQQNRETERERRGLTSPETWICEASVADLVEQESPSFQQFAELTWAADPHATEPQHRYHQLGDDPRTYTDDIHTQSRLQQHSHKHKKKRECPMESAEHAHAKH